MRAEEFDQKFEDGEDVTGDLDLAAIRRPALEQRRVNVDFPSWMIESLDREARRLGSPASPSSRSGSLSGLRAVAPLPEMTHDYGVPRPSAEPSGVRHQGGQNGTTLH
jgi:hypothetical protein